MDWFDDDLNDLTDTDLFERLVSISDVQDKVTAMRRELVAELDARRHPAVQTAAG